MRTLGLAVALALVALALAAAPGAGDPVPGARPPGAPRTPHLPKSRAEIMRERAERERRRRHEEVLAEKARQQRRLAEERKRLVAEERRQLRLQFIAKEEERLRRLQEQQKEASTQLPSWSAIANSTAFDKGRPGGANQNQDHGPSPPKPGPARRPGPAGLDLTPSAPSPAEDVGAFGERLDCYGVPGGYAVRDECGICGGDGSTCADCAGVPNGRAQEDCAGVCNGNDTSCADCAGVLNGDMRPDECGVCGGNNTSCLDCLGEVNGGAVEDACGVCAGDNSTCADCEGTPNGGVRTDPCGVCGGDGTSCCSPVPARPRHPPARRDNGTLAEGGGGQEASRMPEGEAGAPPVLCAGHGTCSAAHRFCLCDHGWTGPFCTVRQNLCLHLEAGLGGVGGFAAAVCNGRGTCDPASGLCRCDDPEAWMGPRCEFSRCSRRGAYDVKAGRCVCEHGYGGAHCERCASTVPREGQRHVCVEIVGAWQPVPRDLFLDRSILLGEESPRAPVFTLIDADAATAEAYLAGHHLINIGNSATGGIRRTVIRPNSTHAASGYYYDCGCRLAAPPPDPQPADPGPEGNVEEAPDPEALEVRGAPPAPPATIKARAYRPFFPKRSTLDSVEAPYAMPLRAGEAARRGGEPEERAPRGVAECSAVHRQILEEYGYSIEAARAESYELARSVGSVSADCDTSFGLAWSVLAILVALAVGALTWLCVWCVQRNVRFKNTTEVL